MRFFHGGFAAALAFLALEELDYGMHYLYLFGVVESNPGNVNLHNIDGVASKLNSLAALGAVLGFGVLPFFHHRIPWPKLRPLVPDRSLLLILVAAFLVRTTAHALDDLGLGHGLEGNISEFRELIMYYLLLAYAVQLGRGSGEGAST